jgi:hypothetical protein
MAAITKQIQLDLFINQQKEIENKMKIESEASMKSQIRLLLHFMSEVKERQNKQEALIQSLVDYILDEKPLSMN